MTAVGDMGRFLAMTGPAERAATAPCSWSRRHPKPGRVKTRLVPPLTFVEAADIAGRGARRHPRRCRWPASATASWSPSTATGPVVPIALTVVAQRGADFTERLADAWTYAGRGPSARTVQIGMDTPQVRAADLDAAFVAVETPGVDTALGLAADGGWWVLAMRGADPGVFHGVPMSTPRTGLAQLAALEARGRSVALLPTLRDVDEVADIPEVAAAAPDTRFAAFAHSLGLTRKDRTTV